MCIAGLLLADVCVLRANVVIKYCTFEKLIFVVKEQPQKGRPYYVKRTFWLILVV